MESGTPWTAWHWNVIAAWELDLPTQGRYACMSRHQNLAHRKMQWRSCQVQLPVPRCKLIFQFQEWLSHLISISVHLHVFQTCPILASVWAPGTRSCNLPPSDAPDAAWQHSGPSSRHLGPTWSNSFPAKLSKVADFDPRH